VALGRRDGGVDAIRAGRWRRSDGRIPDVDIILTRMFCPHASFAAVGIRRPVKSAGRQPLGISSYCAVPACHRHSSILDVERGERRTGRALTDVANGHSACLFVKRRDGRATVVLYSGRMTGGHLQIPPVPARIAGWFALPVPCWFSLSCIFFFQTGGRARAGGD